MPDLLSTPFLVAGVTVRPDRNGIAREGEEARLEPRVMDVLRLLAARPGEVFSRAEMIDALWGVEFGGDESLTRAVSRLRQAFKQIGVEDVLVETVPKRGYRLVAAVRRLEPAPPEEGVAPAAPEPEPEPGPDPTSERSTDPPPPQPATPATTRDDVSAAAAAIVGAVFGGAQTLRRRRVVRATLIYAAFAVAIFSLVEAASGPFQIGAAGQRLILGGVLVGFPLFLVVAWLTGADAAGPGPEALSSEEAKRERRIDLAVIVAVLAGVALAVFRLATISEPTEGALNAAAPRAFDMSALQSIPSNSVAVLPFECPGAEQRDQVLCRGIAFETIGLLSGVSGLRVNSSTHSLRLDLDGMSSPEIANLLQVAHLLSGRLRRDGDRLRVTVELADARTSTVVAAAALSVRVDDEIDAQEAVANAVLAGLGLEDRVATPERVTPLSETELAGAAAMESFSQARWLLAQREPGPVRRALQLLDALSERFPAVADIHASLALAHLLNADDQYGDTPVAQAVAMARPHIDRALALAPDLADGLAANGVAAMAEGRWRDGAGYLERAIARLPGRGDYWTWLAIARNQAGDIFGARRALRQADALDPLSPIVFSAFAEGFAGADPDAVEAAVARYAQAYPEDARLIRADASARLAMGDLAGAHEAIMSLEDLAPPLAALEREELGWIYWRVGLADAARRAWAMSAPAADIEALLAYRLGRCADALAVSATGDAGVDEAPPRRVRRAIYAACANRWAEATEHIAAALDGAGEGGAFQLWPEAPALPLALAAVGARLGGGDPSDAIAALSAYVGEVSALRRENLASAQEVAIAEVYFAVARDDRSAAFAAYRRAIAAGLREPPLLDPALAAWRDDPEFAALAAEFEAVILPHRQRIAEVLRDGSLP